MSLKDGLLVRIYAISKSDIKITNCYVPHMLIDNQLVGILILIKSRSES